MATCPNCAKGLEVAVEAGTAADIPLGIPDPVDICYGCGTVLTMQRTDPPVFRTLSQKEIERLSPIMREQIRMAQEAIRSRT